LLIVSNALPLPITPELDATITIFFVCVSLLYLFCCFFFDELFSDNKDYADVLLKEEPFLTAN
jgi:hypothetical protein